MNSANTEWIPISTPPKPEDFPVWLHSQERGGQSLIAQCVIGDTGQWTHWQKAVVPPPPPRLKTLEDIDREAFDAWNKEQGRGPSFGLAIWLAARADLREELCSALELVSVERPSPFDSCLVVKGIGFAKFLALLKGEQ